MKYLAMAFIAFCTIGCFQRGLDPRDSGSTSSFFHGGPSEIITRIALCATALATVGLIACGFLAWFYPDKPKVAKLAIACGTVLIGSQCAYWLGQHLVAATALCLFIGLLGGAGWVYVHCRQIEQETGLDLDRNGKIG